MIHSAPFGPVGALDAIPAYRLAAGTTLPGLPPLRRLWADAVTDALAAPLACLLKWLSARVVPSAPRVTTRRYAERMPAGTGPSAAYASERRSSTNARSTTSTSTPRATSCGLWRPRGPASPPHAA
jgi:hypothetical protein